ncbi:MAG: GntR family transcriptional regulator [Alphaproteobacteria bacterium]|nr:GntR family transcriptional regulator [Alphaproteobacteria bacterium]
MEQLAVSAPLADRVYCAIRDAICDGQLPPGERLRQDELAERLNVSRQPVLQALLLLRNQGFVRDTGRRGVVVAELEPATIAHLYEMRSGLDGVACRAAAMRAADEAARRGPALIADGRRAVSSCDVGAMIDADMQFHAFLYDLSGNPLIAGTAALHWQHIRRAMGGFLRRYSARDAIWDEHQAMLDAIVAGDGIGAQRLAQEHADRAANKLVAAMKSERRQPRADRTNP